MKSVKQTLLSRVIRTREMDHYRPLGRWHFLAPAVWVIVLRSTNDDVLDKIGDIPLSLAEEAMRRWE